ncbi:hypothetical protein [Lentzea sp. NPDC060358]|uniref:hypothetical protein n=1 Tax=Lentzea sp. NPDC060358 TaxID=3347103 RepID=UPI00366021E9
MKHESITDETVVWVRRQWNNTLSAGYRLADVSEPHWSEFSGGTQTRANRFYVHAYVMCDAAVEGEVAHSCRHGRGPHRIKVCIVAVDNDGTRSAVMRHMRALADADAGVTR